MTWTRVLRSAMFLESECREWTNVNVERRELSKLVSGSQLNRSRVNTWISSVNLIGRAAMVVMCRRLPHPGAGSGACVGTWSLGAMAALRIRVVKKGVHC